jgi:hypothetical protein
MDIIDMLFYGEAARDNAMANPGLLKTGIKEMMI